MQRNSTVYHALRIAAIFVGTMIGAGFASGQELLQFFIVYGSFGIWGIALAGILFALFVARLLAASRAFGSQSYSEFLRRLCGRKSGALLGSMVSVFLYVVLVVMFAAADSAARDGFGLPGHLGRALLALCAAAAAYGGVRGIGRINALATPILGVGILFVGLSSLLHHGFSPRLLALAADDLHRPAPHWLLSCVLYVAYNVALGLAVLVPLGRSVKSDAARLCGSLIGGAALAVCSGVIAAAILVHTPHILAAEIPMLQISCSQSPLHSTLYACAFFLALFTTSSSCLYGCADKLRTTLRAPYPFCIAAVAVSAWLLSGFGFGSLIGLFFPLFGYAAIYILIRLLLVDCAQEKPAIPKRNCR